MSAKIVTPLDTSPPTEQAVVTKPVVVHTHAAVTQVIVVGHSALFYWWPLWVAGYLMALLTWSNHDQAQIGSKSEWFYRGRNLGVIYTLLLLLLILVTSTKIKGMKAALMIAGMAFMVLLFVHLEWWEVLPGWFGHQSISLSLGFYLFSSTMLFLVWSISVFFIDRLGFWRFRSGQVTHEFLGGIVNNTHDTENMTISLIILKPNMPLPGSTCPKQETICEVVDATVKCLLRTVPAAIPGVAFLSGGQSAELASARLNAMNVRFRSRMPWTLAFSLARAIQQPALEIWCGESANVLAAQKTLYHRGRCNRSARSKRIYCHDGEVLIGARKAYWRLGGRQCFFSSEKDCGFPSKDDIDRCRSS